MIWQRSVVAKEKVRTIEVNDYGCKSGEKFDIHKAKEICERYRGVIPVSATPTDVYVAINSQYHDYVELFKSWFGDNVDQKIIESAIIFWFKDVDCKSRNKVVSYFKEY